MGAVKVENLPWLAGTAPRRSWLVNRSYTYAKRALDVAIVLASAPLWLPLLGLCALLVKLESPGGPVFFAQERTGAGGRRFRMLKLRTMVANAEERKGELAHLNELRWPDFKITDDPRITRVGRFLRRTSLDELPQLLNVLRGEMSLVGPRPTSFGSETYEIWQTQRLEIPPGVTGLWQILGRTSTEFDERLRLDIAYAERRSLRLDLAILWYTAFAVLARRGAH